MATNLGLILEQALVARRQGNWPVAQRLYEAATSAAPDNPQIHHNLALCLYARGQHGGAFEHAERATRGAPQLAPAWVLRAKIERDLNQVESAAHSLNEALNVNAAQPQALLELAGLTINELGDARQAQALVAPLLGDPDYDEDAQLTTLMAKLYDRDESAEDFTAQVVAFSRRYLRMPGFRFDTRPAPPAARAQGKSTPGPRRKRIGLLSPLFCVSPVYFFTIGALAQLADEVDLVVFNRGTKSDWGTDKFRAIAREWHDVAHLAAEPLANALYAQDLDALIDLGGWSDPVGLRALSAKPAPCLYKWVGGQSCTTGMDVFDGFISDAQQTPEDCKHLYTEPLLLLEGGYVSYTPPDYMPPRITRKTKTAPAGVISNPVKLSKAFLRALAATREQLAKSATKLRFIDRRYRHASVRERVVHGLYPKQRGNKVPEDIEFVVPESHADYLKNVSELSLVIDTFPYNGGLTIAEALHYGIACQTVEGSVFSGRHGLGHCYHAGYEADAKNPQAGRWQSQRAPKKSKPRKSPANDRHVAVATEMLDRVGLGLAIA